MSDTTQVIPTIEYATIVVDNSVEHTVVTENEVTYVISTPAAQGPSGALASLAALGNTDRNLLDVYAIAKA
jgi:hypothetical protein